MLVIHPEDRTTAMLSLLYEGVPDVRLIDTPLSGKEVGRVLHHIPQSERIMLLGHGCGNGLFWREDDTIPEFDGIMVGHKHAYYLRRHGANLVAVFCNADLFAKANGLHGLFTGMIVTEMSEAAAYGIETTQEELDRENIAFARRLRLLLDTCSLLSDIPKLLPALDDVHTQLTEFNYSRVFYL